MTLVKSKVREARTIVLSSTALFMRKLDVFSKVSFDNVSTEYSLPSLTHHSTWPRLIPVCFRCFKCVSVCAFQRMYVCMFVFAWMHICTCVSERKSGIAMSIVYKARSSELVTKVQFSLHEASTHLQSDARRSSRMNLNASCWRLTGCLSAGRWLTTLITVCVLYFRSLVTENVYVNEPCMSSCACLSPLFPLPLSLLRGVCVKERQKEGKKK